MALMQFSSYIPGLWQPFKQLARGWTPRSTFERLTERCILSEPAPSSWLSETLKCSGEDVKSALHIT